MKRHMFVYVMAALFAVSVLLAGPSGLLADAHEEPGRIPDLLPAYEGYRWGVLGFVDYGHDLQVTAIEMTEDETVYTLSGSVHDLSGGESDADFSIRMEYQVSDEVLVQLKEEETMMDSAFDRIELVRGPLVEGQSWTQEVTDSDGTPQTLNSTITNVSGRPGSRVYTIRYEDPDSSYYEQREIGEARGVLSFERLMQGDEEEYTIHYEVFGETTGLRPDNGFPDVEAEHWYSDTVGRLTAMELLTGYPDGTFGPGRNITVAEFVTVTVETLGFEGDPDHGIWYQPYMDQAVRLGLTEEDTFDRTDRAITREEMTRIIVRALALSLLEGDEEIFTDTEQIRPELRADVRTAYKAGLISGYPDGTFGPQRETTRAEASVLLTRMAERLGSQVSFTRDDSLRLEDAFRERLFHETGDDWVVLDFDSKAAVVDHLSAVTTRTFAREQVDIFYEIRDGELVLMPRDGPVMLITDEPYRLQRVNPLTVRLVQDTVTDMIGDYTLTVTYRMGDGQWLMRSRDVSVAD